MSDDAKIQKIYGFISDALKLVQLGVPIAREAFIIIEIAQTFARRLEVGDIPSDGEVDAAIFTRKSALRDVLNKE